MFFLQAEKTYTLVSLRSTEKHNRVKLHEQIKPQLESTPYLIMDAWGITFTSMQIGELANLAKSFNSRWKGQPHGLALYNVSDTSAEAFQFTNLAEVLPIFESAAEAIASFS